MGFSKSRAKGKVHSNTGLLQENQINNLILHIRKLEKQEMNNPRVSRRKEIIKIRAKINEKKKKRDHSKNQHNYSWFFEKINKIGNN